MKKFNVAVVGATGLVGSEILKVLTELHFPVDNLIPVASAKSVGKQVAFNNKHYTVVDFNTAIKLKPDFALFSAGGDVSLEWAPKFAEAGICVIDNSSAWRMDPNTKLIVPEVNGHLLTKNDRLIANPNCSTIQLVMVLAPLHKKYGIKRVVVNTYQSVSGSGVKALNQMQGEREGKQVDRAYAHTIDRNCIPHCDVFLENGYTKEEMKLVHETSKILDPNIKLTATAVRVPVIGGHSEAVNIEFNTHFDIKEVEEILNSSPGIVVQNDNTNNHYPMPAHAHGKNEVFVGRLRRDESQPNTLNTWIVADNLRKGAATNAVQIAQLYSTIA